MKPATQPKPSPLSMDDDDPHQRYADAVTLPAVAAPSHPPASSSLLGTIRDWVRHAVKGRESSIKDAIEEVLEEHEEEAAALAPQEKAMLHNVLTFADLAVKDIMVPRTTIMAVPQDISLDALKRHIIEQRHTRIPVYRDTLDQVEGFLHTKDLFGMIAGDEPFDLSAVMRPMLFVPPTMRIIDLLVKMRRLGSHMAIVVDEYGGTDGLVTLEDVFEEIVGDIQDEHDEDEEQEMLKRQPDKSIEADARVHLETLEAELGVPLTGSDVADEFDTLGGLIFFTLGRVPMRGEKVTHPSGLRFEIMDSDPRRIKKVRILPRVEATEPA